MAKKDKRLLGKVELMIMQAVWDRDEATVRQVREGIADKRDLAYTTILTMMRKLEQKGLLVHRTDDRTYVYRALVGRGEVEGSMLRDVLQSVFGGSYRQFVSAFMEHEDISREELIRMLKEMDAPSEKNKA